jgi:hypothetical protein
MPREEIVARLGEHAQARPQRPFDRGRGIHAERQRLRARKAQRMPDSHADFEVIARLQVLVNP